MINKFEPNNISRCPECNLVCSLHLFYKEKLSNIMEIFYWKII